MALTNYLKLTLWASNPNPHMTPVFRVVRALGHDVKIIYTRHINPERTRLGWPNEQIDPEYEFIAHPDRFPFSCDADWMNRIHILPGMSDPLHRSALFRLIRYRVSWIHLSEPPRSLGWLRAVSRYPLRRLYGELIERRAMGTLAIGKLAENAFKAWGISADKIGFLPYSLDLSNQPQRHLYQTSEQVRILFAGALIQRKGVDLLLRALAQIKSGENAARASLTIIGSGPEEDNLRGLATELKVDDSVQFLGSQPLELVVQQYVNADIFVLPSHDDGWGAVLNEAANAGLALIGSSMAGAAHHLIKPGINGFRFQSGSVSSLRRCLQAYLNDMNLARVHGKASLVIAEQYRPEIQARYLVAQIQSWIAKERE